MTVNTVTPGFWKEMWLAKSTTSRALLLGIGVRVLDPASVARLSGTWVYLGRFVHTFPTGM
ncbi:hypothetical protein GA0070624_1880 [Micromonospora rhizosphaerae]|uniref:Uncharacterized protein n=1 Tax=Micromonospora rhizosphaerae TaxID=568872 RepID=A0A1C6RS28_9ACTN|nr:hypothetical protein GA0070624_1880 [Micromonospora rhizosphaerae]